MKRQNILTTVLAVLAITLFFAFPVELSVGETWQSVAKRLSLVPKLPTPYGHRPTGQGGWASFLLPDFTCVELIARPRASDGTVVLESITVKPLRPDSADEHDRSTTEHQHISLSGYTFPRFLSYACIAVIFWQVYKNCRKELPKVHASPN